MRTAMTLLAGALTLLVAAWAHAGTLEAAKGRGTLIVGVREDFPPLGYLDADGKHTGFEVDLARYMARQLLGDAGKLQLVPVFAGNRITTLLSDSADMLIAAVMVTDDRAFVIEGSIQEGGLEPVFPEATRVKFWRVSEAVEALRAGRVDAFAEDDVLVVALAKQYPDLAAVGKPFRPHPLAVALPKGDRDLLAWVNDQLRKAKADGTSDTLWNRYFGDSGAILLRP